MIVDCESRVWDLRKVNMDDPKIVPFWDKMMEHGRILTRERAPLELLQDGDALIAMMDRQGIDHTCTTSFGHKKVMGEDYDPVGVVIEAMQKYPDRVTGYVSINPLVSSWKDEFTFALDNGIRAISIYPPEGYYADGPECYELYEHCLNNGVKTIFVHVGLLSMRALELKYAHPLTLDNPARDFPDLNFVAEHFAYPWENDLIAVAWKQPNVYICETYIGAMLDWAPGDFYHAYGRTMRDVGNSNQVVWGSDWAFWSEASVTRHIEALKTFQIPEDMQELYGYPAVTDEMRADLLGNAAARMLGLAERV